MKTIANHNFELDAQTGNSVTYRDFEHDDIAVMVNRTPPKPRKDFPGMERGEFRVKLMDPATKQIIGTVSVSTSLLATIPGTARDTITAVTRGVVADSAFAALIADNRIPLNWGS